MVTSVHAASPATQSVPLLQTRNHYGDLNAYDCGAQDYTISSYDSLSDTYYTEGFASVTLGVISISSVDNVDEGSYTMAVFVASDNPDYDIILSSPLYFALTIEACEVTGITYTGLTTQNYIINDPSVSVTFAEFEYTPTGCDYTFAYSASVAVPAGATDNGQVAFDAATRTFTFYETDMSQDGTYAVTVTATLDDDDATYDDTMTFDVVFHGCASDTVTYDSGADASPYAYYYNGDLVISPSFTNDDPDCPLEYSVSQVNGDDTVVQNSFATATGVFTLSTADLTYVDDTWTITVTATSSLSDDLVDGSDSITFDVDFFHPCHTEALTAPAFSSPATADVWTWDGTTDITFSPLVADGSSGENCGEPAYTVYYLDTNGNAIEDTVSTVDVTDSANPVL